MHAAPVAGNAASPATSHKIKVLNNGLDSASRGPFAQRPEKLTFAGLNDFHLPLLADAPIHQRFKRGLLICEHGGLGFPLS